MIQVNESAVMSGKPADPRRPLISGSKGVKYATEDSSTVCLQAAEAVNATESNKKPSMRPKHKIGTWNVRGLLKPEKLAVVEKEMREHQLLILGLCETHMKGQGHFQTSNGNTMFFSGHETDSKNGTGVIVSRKIAQHVTGYNTVSDRIMTIRIDCNPLPLNIIQIYAPTAQSSQEDIDDFYGLLQTTLDNIAGRELMIVQGDFNAKVGSTEHDDHIRHIIGKYGLGIRNERGEKFIDFCVSNNLTITNTCFEHHKRRLYTWTSPGGRYRNQIDFITVANRWKSSITNVRTFPGADCGSDHQLLVADLRVRLKTCRKRTKSITKFSQPEYEYFQRETEDSLASYGMHTNPDEQWQHLKSHIVKVLESITKKSETRKDWISDEAWANIELRKQLKQSRCINDFEVEYSKLTKIIQKQCRRDKNLYLENICTEIEKHAEKYQTGDLFKKVKQITRKFKPSSWVIDDKHGNPIHEVEKVAERWREYCEELYQDLSSEPIQPAQFLVDNEAEPNILRSEIEDSIRKLKTNKAPGPDRITAEVIKGLGPNGIAFLLNICNTVWETGRWPSDWVHSSILPLHKKGSVRNCNNYRTIALMSHASKILLHIINTRLRSFLDWQIPQEQAGFVKGRGTREQVLNLRLIIEKCYEYDTPTIVCFVDYQKAFDCVKWEKLWEVLRETGVPRHLIRLIQNLYESGYGTVTVGDISSSRFHFHRGVRQGCVISPILFNIYGEYIMRRTLEGWNGGVKVGGHRISNLRYADDTTLFASCETEMLELLHRLEAVSLGMGLAINKSKTKLLIIDRFKAIQRTDLLSEYETVEQFQYLGSVVTNKGSCELEIRRRIGMAKTAMTQLNKVWRDKNITNRTKQHLVRTLVFSIFLYGAETWTIKAADRQRIDAFEMWCWRRLLRIPWTAHRTNVSILKQLKMEKAQPLSSTCLQRVIKYFGHIARRGTNNMERLMVTGKIEGKRPRGRSPKRWSDQISAELDMPISTALHQATDRNRWRSLIDKLKRSHDSQQ